MRYYLSGANDVSSGGQRLARSKEPVLDVVVPCVHEALSGGYFSEPKSARNCIRGTWRDLFFSLVLLSSRVIIGSIAFQR